MTRIRRKKSDFKPLQKKGSEAELNDYKEQVIEDAKRVNLVLDGGFLLTVIVLLLKSFHWSTIVGWQGISNIPVSSVWVVFLLLTIAHFFLGYLVLVRSAHDLWGANSLKHGEAAYRAIRRSSYVFVNRLRPRTRYLGDILIPVYEMNDLPTILSCIAVILLIPAIVPWDFRDLRLFFIFVIGALFIAVINWLIAGTWIVAVSELTIQHDKATYHTRLHEKRLLSTMAISVVPSILNSISGVIFVFSDIRKRAKEKDGTPSN